MVCAQQGDVLVCRCRQPWMRLSPGRKSGRWELFNRWQRVRCNVLPGEECVQACQQPHEAGAGEQQHAVPPGESRFSVPAAPSRCGLQLLVTLWGRVNGPGPDRGQPPAARRHQCVGNVGVAARHELLPPLQPQGNGSNEAGQHGAQVAVAAPGVGDPGEREEHPQGLQQVDHPVHAVDVTAKRYPVDGTQCAVALRRQQRVLYQEGGQRQQQQSAQQAGGGGAQQPEYRYQADEGQ